MHGIKKQLHIWGHELKLFWNRIPFIGRVLFGAVVSLAIVFGMNVYLVKPINDEIAELSEGLEVPENLNPDEDEEVIMNRERAQKLQESLVAWQKRLEAQAVNSEYLNKDVHLDVLHSLQAVMERCGVSVVSERLIDLNELLEAQTQKKRQKSKQAKKAISAPNPAKSGPVDSFIHAFQVRGGFRNIQAFLLLTETLPYRFQIRDIQIKAPNDYTPVLDMNFTLKIFYLTEAI